MNWFFDRSSLLCTAVVGAGLFSPVARAQVLDNSDLPPALTSVGKRGAIIFEVSFFADGKVKACQVVRSNAPYALEISTLRYIEKHWDIPLFAGSDIVVPIVFTEEPEANYWTGDMAVPPNLFPYDGHEHDMTVRVTFGSDGWATDVKVVLPSGLELADDETVAWIKVHWHSKAYAGKTVDAPFQFKRVQPQAKEKAAIAPAKPNAAEPAPEPAAIPAVRAQ